MNFAWALDQMMQGKKVTRKCWGSTQRIYVEGEGNFIQFKAENNSNREGISISPHFTLNANCAYAYDWELFTDKN